MLKRIWLSSSLKSIFQTCYGSGNRPAIRKCLRFACTALIVAVAATAVPSIVAGDDGGSLFPWYKIPSGGSHSVTRGDFNGDGTFDLATVDPVLGRVSVIVGWGDGTFSPPHHFPAGNLPSDLAAGDFNGDGIADLAAANRWSNDVSVLLGVGDGTFAAAQDFNAGTSCRSLTTGDFNGDGFADIATVNAGSATCSVLIGHGDGTFSAAQEFRTGNSPYELTSGDFNGDGVEDLAISNIDGFQLHNGIGDGSFLQGQATFLSEGGFQIVAADLDGDGTLDLMTGGTVLLGMGEGSFSISQELPDFAVSGMKPQDIDGDGVIDLVGLGLFFKNRVRVAAGVGDGTFELVQRIASAQPDSMTVGDYDGDGLTDLIIALGTKTVSLLPGKASGQYEFPGDAEIPLAENPTSVATADFNNDGFDDIVAMNEAFSVVIGQGDGTFEEELRFEPGISAGDVVTNDFDGDGHMDMAACVTVFDKVVVLPGIGNGSFGTALEFDTSTGPNVLLTDDIDGDEVVDIVTLNSDSASVSVLFGIGDGTFSPSRDFGTGSNASGIVSQDFDGDDLVDLAVCSWISDRVSILTNLGDGTFSSPQTIATLDAVYIASADFNGDGLPDLVTANGWASVGSVSVLMGLGDGTFSAGQTIPTSGRHRELIAADANGDGQVDVLVSNSLEHDLTFLPGLGDGSFGTGLRFLAGNTFASGDFDGNGSLDLVTSNIDSSIGGLAILFNQCKGPKIADVLPVSVKAIRGDYVSGGVPELSNSDDVDYSIRRRSSDLIPRTEFVVKSVSPVSIPVSFSVTLEASVFARSAVIQSISLFDYDADVWEIVDARNAARFGDAIVTISGTGDLGRFVEPGSGCVEARIRFESDTQRQLFSSNTDHFFWTIE